MVWKFKSKKSFKALLTSRNDLVRQSLAEHGDNGVAARHVIHFAYPNETTELSARPQIVADLKAQGFDVRDAASGNGLVFEHHRSVAPDDFDAFTDKLEVWFHDRGWDYDGWECAVVSGKLH